MKVKELIEEEKNNYETIMVADVRNITFPHNYMEYDVIDYNIKLVDSYSLTTGKKHTRKVLYITCKKVSN